MSLSIGVVMSGSTAKADNDYALPATPGLYVSEYIEWDNDIVKTNKDQSNNVILINHNNEQIKWRDQDNPEYLTVGMSDDNTEYWWGPGFENGSEIWLDYIADGKVTHLNQEDISITELDGSPCEDISLSPDSRDQRVCVFHMNTSETKKVIISYKTPDNLTNSKFVAEFALRTGFYYDEEMSVDSHIIDEPTVVRGSDKDIYVHLTDTWEGDGFSLNDTNAISISYWDDEKKTDANVEGEDAKEFAELEPVSVKNDNHLIYKLKLKGSDKVYDRYEVIINYNRYNKTNVEEAPREEDRRIQVKIIDSDTLYAASQDNLQVQGDHYYYPDNSDYRKNDYFSANSLSSPIYMSFRFYNEEGGIVDLMDPSTLSFYRSEYNEDLKKEILTKVDSSVVKAEKAYSDSNIIKISYVGDTTKEENDWNEFIVTYGDKEPSDGNMGDAIELAFVTSDFDEVGTYNSTEINESTFSNEFNTDGTSDVNIYAATLDYKEDLVWNYVESAELKSLKLIDEKGSDLSSKVNTDTNVKLTRSKKPAIVYGEKITIPKGVLSSSARLELNFTANCNHWLDPEAGTRTTSLESYTVYAYIIYTPHTHTAVSDWSKDDNNHWHECTASDGATLDKAAHTWDNGVVTTPAATDKEGVMTYTCTVCKATKTQSIDKLPQPTIQPDTTQTTTQTTDTSQTSKVETGTSTTLDEKGVTYTVTEVNTDGTAEVEFSAKDSTEKTIVIPETTTVNGVTATVTTIANNAFLGNKTVSSVTIPETVDTIGKNAFSNCTSIKKITIPKSVTTIGENAFSGCTNLTTVNIKSTTISKIETGAFKNCKKLTKVTVPSSITTIGKNAFSGDKNLKTITIKSTKIKSIGKNAFKNVPKKATIKVPKKKKTTYAKLLKKAGFKGKIK